MPTNFLQWNPGAANQENDAGYAADSQRANGAINGQIFNDQLSNKLFYQLSSLVAALAQALSNKGYSIVDTNYGSLVSQLSNLVTFADLRLGIQTVAFSTTPTFNALGTNGFDFTMSGNVTSSTLTNPQVGQIITFVIKQGGTTFTFSPPSNINGWLPIDPTPNSVTVQAFIVKSDGTIWPLSTEISLILGQISSLSSQISVLTTPTTTGNILISNGTSFVSKGLQQNSLFGAGRVFNTTYTNNTGAPLMVSVTGQVGSGGGSMTGFTGSGSPSNAVCTQARVPAASSNPVEGVSIFFMVPVGWTYSVNSFDLSLILWTEWSYV